MKGYMIQKFSMREPLTVNIFQDYFSRLKTHAQAIVSQIEDCKDSPGYTAISSSKTTLSLLVEMIDDLDASGSDYSQARTDQFFFIAILRLKAKISNLNNHSDDPSIQKLLSLINAAESESENLVGEKV